MYDLTKIKPKSEFLYWFIRQGISGNFDIYVRENGEFNIKIGTCYAESWEIQSISLSDAYLNCDMNVIKEAFSLFYHRPEYIVGIQIPAEIINTTESNAATFEKLITGCVLMQMGDEAKALKTVKRFLDWFHSTDFYNAPASTRFHDCEHEGLLKHSLRVVNHIIMLLQLRKFSEVAANEAVFAALLHDISKCDVYELYMRNVKDEETGTWSQVPSYRYKNSKTPFGHSCSSLYLSQKYFPCLTMEQCLAIRHHMGAYGVSQSENSDLSEANANFKLNLLLQWADQSSVTVYGQV